MLLMFVMAFSITPKRTLHEIFGCHDKTQRSSQDSPGKLASVGKASFHCSCDQPAFQASFLLIAEPFYSVPFSFIKTDTDPGVPISYHSSAAVLQPLRGPPAAIGT